MGEFEGYAGDQVPQGTGDGTNPAWQPFLEAIPQEYHETVTPVLKEWDQGVQNKIQKVHSEYEPWKPVIEAGGDPETAQFALNLLHSINEQPEMVYNALGEHYGLSKQQQQQLQQASSGQGQDGTEGEDDPYESRFSALEQQNEMLARALLEYRQGEENQRAQQQADAELDQELSGLRQQYGDFNERAVLGYMLGGLGAEDAIQAWMDDAGRHRPKPLIAGPGGGSPGTHTDVRKLDEKGTKNLVVDMLRAAAEQREQ